MNESSQVESADEPRERPVWLWVTAALVVGACVAVQVYQWCKPDKPEPLKQAGPANAAPDVPIMFSREDLADADRRLAAALAEAELLDGRWRLEEIEKLELAALMPPKPQPEGGFGGGGMPAKPSPPPTAPLTPAQLADLRADLNRDPAKLALARQFANQPRGSIPLTWAKNLRETLDEVPEMCREAWWLLSLDVQVQAQEGDIQGALQSCQAILNVGAALGHMPTYGAQNFRSDLIQMYQLETVLALGEPPARALAALQARLTAEADIPFMLIAARGERAALDRLCEAMQTGAVPVPDILHDLGEDWLTFFCGKERSAGDDKRALTAFRAVVLETMNRKVEIHKLPLEQQGEHWKQLQESMRKAHFSLHRLVRIRALESSEGQCWRRAHVRCIITALAVERYRQHQGRWPETLIDLVPGFLTAVPIDPSTSGPLGYHRQKEGVAVYFVRSDRSHAGEVAIPHDLFETSMPWYTNIFGFRLWEPQLRRQARNDGA